MMAPEPFLQPVFEPGIELVIASGFNYLPEEIALHGVESHRAIDFDAPRGTKILAPADGYYLCTYGEVALKNEDGSPRLLGLKQARAVAASTSGLELHAPDAPPVETVDGDPRWPVYFGSFVVQGWHGRGRYTQYAHVDWVNPAIPFHAPIAAVDDAGRPTGDLKHSAALRLPVAELRRPANAVFVKAGEVIAEVGMTGCGWAKRCYDFARFDAAGRPDFRGADYPHYNTPHLHFAVFGRRAPKTRRPAAFYDPFGLYAGADGGYPTRTADWSKTAPGAPHPPLWLKRH